MTACQMEGKELLEESGWKIFGLSDAADIDAAVFFGGDN